MNLTPRSFSNYSIRTKLTILTTAAMMLALVILSVFALSALIYSQWLEHEKDLLLKTRLLSAITLVSFGSGDKKPMNAALSALATDRSFLTVTIYYPDGTIAAAYNRDSETKTPALDSRPAGSQAVWDKLYFKHEIMQEGQSAGYIVIQDDLREFFRFIWIFIEGVFLAFIFSSAAGYFFLSRTRTWITSPVSRLADIMTRVSVTGDYSVRYKSEGKDEISAMISSFNEMLDQIGIRDSKLEEYSRNLEEKVFVGTRELQEKNLALKSELARRIQIENDLNREKELFIHGPVVAFKCKSEEGWPLEYISPNAGQYGYNQAELMKGDRKFEELVYASEKTKFNDDITNWLKEKTASFQGEYRLLNDNGEIFWFDITMVAVRPETGKTTHLDGYLLNITERKRNEEKLKATMEDLKRFNKLMSGREEMVLELKASLNEFMERTGLQPKYKTTADTVLPRLAFDAKKPQPDPEPSPAGADAAKRAGLEKTEVRLAIVGTTCPEPLIEAKDKGLFAQRGLNVSVRTVASWSGARELLAARKVDGIYVQVTYALLISAGYGGAPVKLKLHPVSHANDYVLALKSQLEKTGGPSNIKGKVIGVPGQYSTGQYLLYQCLADSGINPLADVRIVSVDMEKAPFYLRHGLVDGMFCRKGVLDDMEFRGEVNYFKHSRDIWRGHPCCGIALDKTFFEDAPNTTAALLDVYDDALDAMAYDPGTSGGRRLIVDEDGKGGVWLLSQMQRWGHLTKKIDHWKIVEETYDTTFLPVDKGGSMDPPPGLVDGDLEEAVKKENFSIYSPAPENIETSGAGEFPEDELVSTAESLSRIMMGESEELVHPLREGEAGRLQLLTDECAVMFRLLNDSLAEIRENMEKKIEERIRDLSASRKIALSMMEDSQEARHRAEIMADELKEARMAADMAAGDLKQTLLVSEELRAETEKSRYMAEKLAREAKEASEAKSEFMANMSHELRTPLNGVIGLTEMLLKSGVTSQQRKSLEMINFSGNVLLNLVNDILDLSRIEAGKLVLTNEIFNLRNLVEVTCEQYALAAEQKGLELVVDMACGLPWKVEGDPGRLNQVLANLIGNAIKFTEKGEVTVNVSPVKAAAGRFKALFEVRDTGIGIEEDKQDLIFQRFTQGDSSITRKYGGAGLGVTISRQLVGKMGGEIEVKSKPGVETIFSFTIDFGAVDETQEEKVRLEGVKIAVVDDNASSRGAIAKIVRSFGAKVDEFKSGMEVLTSVIEDGGAGPYNALVIDERMPGMSGSDLARKVKSVKWAKKIKIIMLSSIREFINANESSASWDSVVVKPVKRDELCKAIIEVRHTSNKTAERQGKEYIGTEDPILKILLAEDNPVNQEVAMAMLTRMGHAVDVAGNGKQAVDMWLRANYDLVLMDVQMPVMDGYSATSTIRLLESENNKTRTPIIAMTAHAMDTHKQKCMAVGMDGYISKPVNMTKLSKTIGSYAKTREEGKDIDHAPQEGASAAHGPLETLASQLGLDREKAQSLLIKFLRTTQQNIQSLKKAREEKDHKSATRFAHSIKGSSLQVGMLRLGNIASQMEEMRESSLFGDKGGELLASMDVEFHKVKTDLGNQG